MVLSKNNGVMYGIKSLFEDRRTCAFYYNASRFKTRKAKKHLHNM